MLVSGLLCFSFSLQGCGPSPKPAPVPEAPLAPLEVLGAPCNVMTAEGCNPIQLPLVPTPYDPQCSARGSSSKCWFNLQPEDHAVVYDWTEERSEDITAELAENIQQVSRSNTRDFGIEGVVPFLGPLAFSAGVRYREVSKEMNLYGTEQFLATVQRRNIVYSASLSSAALEKLATRFRKTVDALPQNPASDEEYVRWFHFFERFGTHYVKKVSYGGVMRMSLFLKSTVKEDARIKQGNWNFYLQLTFAKLAGIKFPFGPGHSEEEYEAFHHYTLHQHFFAKGGNQSEFDYAKWLVTLKAKPAPVQTQLGSIEDFFNNSIAFRRILKKYMASCPSSETLGVCNGYGVCDFAKHSCECNAIGAYKENDGNCYPTCENNCSGHGECKNGVCQCHFDAKVNMGFMSTEGEPPCSTPCGSKIFDAGESHVWCISGSAGKNCRVLGKEAESPKCWCRGVLKSLEDVDGASAKPVDYSGSTYSCEDTSSSCDASWPTRTTCPAYQQIQCTHGQHLSCSNPNSYHAVDFVGDYRAEVTPVNFSSDFLKASS